VSAPVVASTAYHAIVLEYPPAHATSGPLGTAPASVPASELGGGTVEVEVAVAVEVEVEVGVVVGDEAGPDAGLDVEQPQDTSMRAIARFIPRA
jgi:hypothetical protein